MRRFIKKKHGVFATVIVTLAIVIVSLFSQTTYGVLCKEDINAMDLSKLNTFIQDMGVPARVEGTTILIPENRFTEVKVALAANDLAYTSGDYDSNVGILAVSAYSSGAYDSKQEDLTKAMQRNLENTLTSNFDKIAGANVTLFFTNDFFTNDKCSASVNLTTSEILKVSEIEKIVQLISKSIDNIQEENIQITDQDSNILYPVD